MADATAADLKRQLGADLKILGQLSVAETKLLSGLMGAARVHQQAALQKALEGALSHLPMLLRAPVRKVLGL